MNFKYSLSHLDFANLCSKKQVLDLLQNHDNNSFAYSIHTGQLNMAIGTELHFDSVRINLLFQSGVFHDTGKLGMCSEFLNFPGAYTVPMYQEMKKHSEGGARILTHIEAETEIIETAKFHHSNYDGSGYPSGQYADEIPLFARITRISDSIDAFMTRRCYKEGGPTNQVLEDLMQYSGTSYDPHLLIAFQKVHNKVMKKSHDEGIDSPSQLMYMHYIDELYGTKEKDFFLNETLD